jgi:uncharacterized protein YjbI with pentapeptide repeats
MTGITGNPILPTTWKLLNGSLFGGGADISGTDLTNLDLSAVDLAGIKTSGIINGTYRKLTGTPKKLPAKWKLVSGVLVGPGANLTGADLTNANLSGVDLTGANLSQTQLDGANLSKANLTGATINSSGDKLNLSGANLTDVKFPGSYLTNSNFTKANLTRAYFGPQYTSSFAGSDLTGATITDADMMRLEIHSYCPDSDPAHCVRTKMQGIVGTPATYPGGYNQSGFYALVKGNVVGPDMNLQNADISNSDLTGISLVGADLTGAKLVGSSLIGTDTTRIVGKPASIPADADLVGEALIAPGVKITTLPAGANLANTNLTKVNFSMMPAGVRSGGIVGNPYNWPTEVSYGQRYGVINGYIVGPQANLSNAILSGVDFDTYFYDLTGANLNGANLGGAKLSKATLGGASADFPDAGTRTANIKGTPASLPDGAKMVGTSIVARGVNLAGANLSKQDLHGSDFSNMGFVGANFAGANLSGVNFSGSNLTGADLSGIDLSGVNFTDAILTNAKVGSAKLADSTLKGVRTGGLSGKPTSIPASLTLNGGFLLGPNVSLVGANLSKMKITGVNLDGVVAVGATLTGLVSSGITGTMTLDGGRGLINGHLVGPGVDISKVTDLNGQDFSNVDLTGANVTNTDLGAVTLTGATTGKLVGTPKAVTTGYKFLGGFIIGPGVRLQGKDLSKLNLTGINLTGVDFRSAILTGATLTGATISNANFGREDSEDADENSTPDAATLTGVISGGLVGDPTKISQKWIVAGGFLAGPGANLTKADLTNVDLSGYYQPNGSRKAELNGINITGATMTGARLPMINGGWTKIVGTPKSLPSGFKLVKGVLSYS